jgi:methyltransferase (TIGR00027 family)
MRAFEPSRTAAWVAASRGLATYLPEDARLAEDPYGLAFAGRLSHAIARGARRFPRLGARALAREHLLSMQIRTRVLDDVLRGFLVGGGRQVLILGAGFDCRAARFRSELGDAAVFEVDHPATQEKKRATLARAAVETGRVAYLPWDFEHEETATLPDRLAAAGHDRARVTLTIWEGVSMYLTEEAIEATVGAVRALSAPRSPFAFTYLDRHAVKHPAPRLRVLGALAARLGEPIRFGWDPATLPAWLAPRGFALVWDHSDAELARELLPPRYAARGAAGQHRFALAERT